MNRFGILTAGNCCVDYNLSVDAWPLENDRADILTSIRNGGGSAFNMALDLKALDPALAVATLCLVGDDDDGRFLRAQAGAAGVDCSQMMTTAAAGTDYTHAYSSRRTGRRTNLTHFGTSNVLAPEHFDFADSTHRLLHLGLPGVHERMDATHGEDANGWVTTLKRARAAGLQTNLEMVSIAGEKLARLVRPCLPHLDLLIVNDIEIAGLMGYAADAFTGADPKVCVEAAKAALNLGAVEIVVVHFPLGAVAACRDGRVALQPSVYVPPSEVAGANGAGDAFAAGFLYAFHQGWTVSEALRLAHAAAAASLRQITTTGAMESAAACLALAARWGWRESFQ